MNSCEHVAWLHLSGREHYYIHQTDRISRVNWEMTCASSPRPSVICFVGRKHKSIALRELFPHNNIRRSHQSDFVNVHLDSSFPSADLPLLIFDSAVPPVIPSRISEESCHGSEAIDVSWQVPVDRPVADYIYARLIFLFSDVICIFADDFGGLEGVAQHLVAWIRIGTASTLPSNVRPRVVIVAPNDSDAVTHSFLELESLRFSLDQEDQIRRNGVFASITLMRLAGSELSALARHRRLKEVLLKELDLARAIRIEERVLFTANHLASFLQQAVQHTAKSLDQPFDFIAGTRAYNSIGNDYEDHLCRFLQTGLHCYISAGTLIGFIASSILMDAYPPRMHGMSSNTVPKSM